MTKSIYSIVFLLSLILTSYAQEIKIGDDITIDPNINSEVEKHISPLSGDSSDTLGLIYYSNILWDAYEGDSLINSTFSNDSLTSAPFKAFYILKEDSLFILGEYGLISGFRYGFVSIVKDENLKTNHFFCDEFPAFKHKITDSLDYCIDVSCPIKKLVLSELPVKGNSDPIYGYVEFLTDEFYGNGDKGIKKIKSRMKIYFKAKCIEIKE